MPLDNESLIALANDNAHRLARYSSKDADFNIGWPTGFAGTGHAVKDMTGRIVFRAAWRLDCLVHLGQMVDDEMGNDAAELRAGVA